MLLGPSYGVGLAAPAEGRCWRATTERQGRARHGRDLLAGGASALPRDRLPGGLSAARMQHEPSALRGAAPRLDERGCRASGKATSFRTASASKSRARDRRSRFDPLGSMTGLRSCPRRGGWVEWVFVAGGL